MINEISYYYMVKHHFVKLKICFAICYLSNKKQERTQVPFMFLRLVEVISNMLFCKVKLLFYDLTLYLRKLFY